MKTKIILMGLATCFVKADLSAQTTNFYNNWAYSMAGIYGTDNVGLGYGALNTTGSGPFNTATGYEALLNNNNGANNTADGKQALHLNVDGSNNTATGYQSLYNNGCLSCQGGNNNTATGYQALYSNTEGNENTAFGDAALYSNTRGRFNTAEGTNALHDNNSQNGINGEENTAFGHSALKSNLEGSQNTAAGRNALQYNLHGNENTALGFEALRDNVAYFSNAPARNTAAGRGALRLNQTGYGNTAVGSLAMELGINGFNNTAIGYSAHQNVNSAQWNVSIGGYAGANNGTETGNVAIGAGALFNNVSGEGNTAIGTSALGSTYSGDYNTALGWSAMMAFNIGDHNTCLGYAADLGGVGARYNAASVGWNAVVNADNEIRLGDPTTLVVETQWNWSWISDGRFKYNLSEKDVVGLEFIKRLRPVVYNFDAKKYMEFVYQNTSDSTKHEVFSRKKEMKALTEMRQTGFIAQEVEKAAKDVNYDFNGVVKPTNEGDNYGVNYALMVVPLVKAVQEQQAMLEEQKQQNEQLKKELDAQTEAIKSLLKDAGRYNGIVKLDAMNGTFMMEAQPNPFSRETIIRYSLPSTTGNAFLTISDLSGKQIVSYPITEKGSSSITITSEKLEEGMYIYSIIADGKLMGSKRLVVASH